jgi:pyruvate formate lyase activating enzyme
MSNTIYSVAGCTRCKITKRFMVDQDIAFDDFDINAEGKEAFAKFYRANRSQIFRDKDGVEFPVFTDGSVIRQGASVIMGYLMAGDGLDGFINRSVLHGEWIDGFNISGGNPDRDGDLIRVLSYLKKSRMKIQLFSDGRNAGILEKIVAQGLGDRMVMEIKGPAALYAKLTGQDIKTHELEQSIRLAAKFDEYQFYTIIAPVVRGENKISYLSPDEIGMIAKMIESATQSKKEPYQLRTFDPSGTVDEALKSVEPLPDSVMFKYRSAARRHIVITEIEKT